MSEEKKKDKGRPTRPDPEAPERNPQPQDESEGSDDPGVPEGPGK